MKKKTKKKKLNIPNIVYIIAVILGIFIMLYPVIINHFNRIRQEELIKIYNEKSDKSTDNNKLIEEAKKYNKSLYDSKILNKYDENEKNFLRDYYSLLNLDDEGMMGYIEIPKLDVEIPIYHSTEEKVLQKGVGHLTDSSLPVGGKNSHAVLSGHRGLASSRLFTDLDQLIIGDMFYIHILGQTLAYEIDQIKIVKPDNTDYLKLYNDKDYITLVTCAPYAINTHRLLLRGTRVQMNQKIYDNIKVDRSLSTADIVLIIGIIIVIIILIIVVILVHKINKKMIIRRGNIIEDMEII